MTNPDDNRAAFEAWAKENYKETLSLRRKDYVEYSMYYTKVAYEAWQAAIEHAMKTICNRS